MAFEELMGLSNRLLGDAQALAALVARLGSTNSVSRVIRRCGRSSIAL
ncbi:MAG: hypothetical protein ABIR67_03225 [Gaiellaceae bacterium]